MWWNSALGGLRGFASLEDQDDTTPSPRVAQLRIEELDFEDDEKGKIETASPREVRFGGHSTRKYTARESISRNANHVFYTICGSPILFPILTLFVCNAFACGLATYLWKYRKPVIAEGAFGKLAQNTRNESVQEANFQKARVRAVSGPTLLGLGNGTLSVGADIGWQWRRLELIYQVREGSFLGSSGDASKVMAIKDFETTLRKLSGWQMLCNERVPQALRRYCDPGDSFAAVVYSTMEKAEWPASSQGVREEIIYDGEGASPILPIDAMLSYLQSFHPENLDRWLNINLARGDVIEKSQVMRTMFAFYLPDASAGGEWSDFVSKELEPELQKCADKGEDGGFGGMHMFYRADGIQSEEFTYAVNNAIIWAGLAAMGSAGATVLVTRRFLLAGAAMVLAGISSATAAASVSKFHEDGFVELPAIAISSWFLVAANSADLAIACLRSWENVDPFPRTTFAEFSRILAAQLDRWQMPSKKMRLICWYVVQMIVKILETAFPPREGDTTTPETTLYPVGKLWWFIVSMCAPQAVSVVFFLKIAHSTELLLLEEFASHAGTGLMMATIFGVLVYPPVIDLGDGLCEMAQRISSLRKLNDATMGYGLLTECGGKVNPRNTFLRRLIEVFARTLNGRPVRVLALLITVVVTCIAIVTEFASAFVATPPPLFPVGHRSREGPKVQAQFGQLPKKMDAPDQTLTGTRKCNPDAFDNATCGFFLCEVEAQKVAEENKCLCFHKLAPTTVTTSTVPSTTTSAFGPTPPPAARGVSEGGCSAVARIAGISDHDDFPQAEFWKWSEAQLNLALGDNNQLLRPQAQGSVEMEDWATGSIFIQKQFSIGRKTANNDVPGIEDACAALICYCNIHTCTLNDEWKELGQFEHSMSVTTTKEERRLVQDISAQSMVEAPTTPFPTVSEHVLLVEPRRLDEPDEEIIATQKAEIYVIWGLAKSKEIPFRTSSIDLKFDRSFNMEDPWTQRSILSLCEGTGPMLQIDSRQCWAMDFKRWVIAKGLRFPVTAETFYPLYFEFTFYRHSEHLDSSSFAGGGASGGRGYDYFWLAEDGRVQGTFVAFDVTAPQDQKKIQEYMSLWSSYMSERNRMSEVSNSVQAWMASTLFAESQTAAAVRDSARSVFVWMVIFASLTVAVLTFSLGLTIAVVMCLCCCLLTFATFWIGVGNRDIGSLEIVSLSVFLSGLSCPLLRMTYHYSYARDRPHYPSEMLQKEPEIPKNIRSVSVPGADIDLQAEAKKLSDSMAEGEILMFPGALANERQHRVATAMLRGGTPALGFAMACIVCGIALMPLEMEALGQVGLSVLCMGFAVPPAVIGLLPVLLLLGLGDSKARRKAFLALVQFLCDRCHGRIDGGQGLLDARSEGGIDSKIAAKDAQTSSKLNSPQFDPTAHKPHAVAAVMLGVPQFVVTGSAVKTPSFSKWSAKLKSKEDKKKNNTQSPVDDIGAEVGPCILTLDVQGATAKPPYHIVMATRDVINMKG